MLRNSVRTCFATKRRPRLDVEHHEAPMPVLNIAAVATDDLARLIAKPSDQRDVHTYVHKEMGDAGARILSIIRPAKYPERLRPLLNALSAARVGLIEVQAVDAALGEALVAFASAGLTQASRSSVPKTEVGSTRIRSRAVSTSWARRMDL